MGPLQTVGLVLGCQAWAPALLADLPSLRSLTVTSVDVKGPGGLLYGRFAGVPNPPRRQLVVRGTATEGRWTIGIDLDARVIGYADWHVITGQDPGSSGELGVALLGLPGILASLPLQVPWWAFRALGQRMTGLTLHQQLLFVKLRPQLPQEHQVPFLLALRNENNGRAAAHWESLREARP